MTPVEKMLLLRAENAALKTQLRKLRAELADRDKAEAERQVRIAATVAKLAAIRERIDAREPWHKPADFWKHGNPENEE